MKLWGAWGGGTTAVTRDALPHVPDMKSTQAGDKMRTAPANLGQNIDVPPSELR